MKEKEFQSSVAQVVESDAVAAWDQFMVATELHNFFPIAYAKQLRTEQKKTIFSNRKSFKKIIVICDSRNMDCHSNVIEDYVITSMPLADIENPDRTVETWTELLDGSLVLFTSNNGNKIGPGRLLKIVQSFPNTIFAVHDYDNHHWFKNSLAMAAISDVYVPAHIDNLSIFARVNQNIVTGIPIGTLQWSKNFLRKNTRFLTETEREIGPLGKYYFVGKARYRNSVIRSFNEKHPEVSLLTEDYHERDPIERWKEWTKYKLHVIVPVFNDVPIRFFDALLAGGIPLVPHSLRPHLEMLGVPGKYYLCYSPRDIIDSSGFMQAANELFVAGGLIEIWDRHCFALNNFHIDATILKLIKACERIVGMRECR
jgi:hypothetical protein